MSIDEREPKAPSAADVAERVLERSSGDRLDIVRFTFNVTDGPNPIWHVRRFQCSEGLSTTYELVVDLLTDELDVDTDALLGANAELDIERGSLLRSIQGVIHRVDYIGVTGGNLLVRLYVVPALALLRNQVTSRIFQDLTVPEILKLVLEQGLNVYERKLELRLGQAYPKRDYCVQYGESLYDFAARLMEEEGITYFFEPDADAGKELLVLVDQNSDQPNAGFPDLVDLLMEPQVPIIPENTFATADRESIRHFEWCRPEQVNRVVVRGWNWKIPAAEQPPEGEASVDDPRGRVREHYAFSDRRRIVDTGAGADPAYDGGDLEPFGPAASRRLELFSRRTEIARGESNVTGFCPGRTFELGDHGRDDLAFQKYLLTRVTHRGEAPDVERADAGSRQGERYTNTFECIPATTPHRPALVTERPRIYGPQTATVVGPPGEEIHTDLHGRIRLYFHWDREGRLDDTASCWVRVAQGWSGPGWGTLFIPRVGMEVVVEFLDGNPDRPLVTGCVYNGKNTLPYALPDDKTKSTIKTQSSPGGDGFNELRFEDAAGAEEIFLHAQKDFNEKVENDHNTNVGANQTNTVGGDQTETVRGNQTMSVEKERKKTVTEDETNVLQANRKTDVAADDTLKVMGLSKRILVAGLEETVTKFSKLTVSDLYEVKVKGAQKISVDGTSELTVSDKHMAVATNVYSIAQKENASVVLQDSKGHLWGADEAGVEAGEGHAVLKCEKSGKLGISAKNEISITVGKASITLKSDGSVSIGGDTKVEITGGKASSVKLAAAGAEVGAPMIKSVAAGTHEIVGAMVKIN